MVQAAKLVIKIKPYSHFNLIPVSEFCTLSTEIDFFLESSGKKIRGFTGFYD